MALTSLLFLKIQRNGLLRDKGVVILDMGHHLTSQLTDIKINKYHIWPNLCKTCKRIKPLNCVVKITFLQNTVKEHVHQTCFVLTLPKSKFRVGNFSEHYRRMSCLVSRQSQNMLSGCCSPCKRYKRVNFECLIRTLEMITSSSRLENYFK